MFRVLQGERLGNETTHRPSEDVHPLDAERFDYSLHVIGELSYVKWPSVVRGVTDSAIVKDDELVERGKSVDKRRIPIRTCRREAVQDHERPAIPNSTISDLCPINLE